jgi:hypothetical protein
VKKVIQWTEKTYAQVYKQMLAKQKNHAAGVCETISLENAVQLKWKCLVKWSSKIALHPCFQESSHPWAELMLELRVLLMLQVEILLLQAPLMLQVEILLPQVPLMLQVEILPQAPLMLQVEILPQVPLMLQVEILPQVPLMLQVVPLQEVPLQIKPNKRQLILS